MAKQMRYFDSLYLYISQKEITQSQYEDKQGKNRKEIFQPPLTNRDSLWLQQQPYTIKKTKNNLT